MVTHCAIESASHLRYLQCSTALFSVPTFDAQALSTVCDDAATLTNQPDAHNNQPLLTSDYPIIIDTGASASVSPNPDDFAGGLQPTSMMELEGLNNVTTVRGYGPVNPYGTLHPRNVPKFKCKSADFRKFHPNPTEKP